MNNSNQSEKVVVGLSGGVDSTVAAYLLKEKGYQVIGATMQIWQDQAEEEISSNGGCCGLSAVDDARRVADKLNIPYYVMNFKQDFEEKVIQYFIHEYVAGRTPNPCIACNRYVKWESLLGRSMEIGASYIATGHYARVVQLENGRYVLKKSATQAKDQTYALYNLTQHQLSHTLMPVGDYTKDQIREIAGTIDLVVANKRDSQEICFIPDNDYAGFIERNTQMAAHQGNFVNSKGEIVGTHLGITHYTVGQRKGLNLSLGRPVFVLEIRPQTNEVVIGDLEESFSTFLYAKDLNFMPFEHLEGAMEVVAKIRYNHQGAPCRIEMAEKDLIYCQFSEPQRAISPGQAVVFYDGDVVVGGGTICSNPLHKEG